LLLPSLVYWQPLELWDITNINYAKDAVTRSNLNELANALKVEDNKLNICSNFPADNPYANTAGNGYYCVNENS